MKVRILTFLSMVLLVAACSTGKKALEQGNYYQAIAQAVERLQRNPDSKKATNTLRQGYPLAVKYYTEEIRQAEASTDPFRFEKVMDSYATLNAMDDIIRRCPACRQAVPNTREYTRQYEMSRRSAAEARYQAGMTELQTENRERAKDAYWHFERVEEILPGYKNAREMSIEALDAASLKVLVDVAPVPARRYQLSSEFFANKIYEYLNGPNINRFVRFYTPDEADRLRVTDPDHVIALQFDDFVVGETHIAQVTETVKRDSVNTGTVKVNGETVPVYGTVEAKLTRFTKTVSSRGLLDMQVYDARTRRVLMQQKMPGEFNWTTQWANFQGDQRALSDQDIDLCELREAMPPNPQQLFVEFTRPIYDQVVGHIRRYYANY